MTSALPPTLPPAAPSRRHRAHAPSRGRLWSGLGVALAAVGCAPPGPLSPASATDAMRTIVKVGAPLNVDLSVLRAGSP